MAFGSGPKIRDGPPAPLIKQFQKALSERIKAGDVLTIDKFAVSEIKTKSFVDLVRKQTDAEKVLIVSDSFDDKTYKSARNVKPRPGRCGACTMPSGRMSNFSLNRSHIIGM